ncbi:DMT family transporter [Ezakiella peruensis]|uniref:DMT family transporter n=1 Tax=Ezakiella peruensis TaxID=1464038 RepID=UPI000C1B4A84|nr:DMT family transporter [Ezakiella peruensis]
MDENIKKASILMLLSAFSFAVMQMAVKYSAQTVPVVELVVMRNLFLVFTSIISLKKQGKPYVRDKKNIPKLFLRGFFGMLGVLLYFIATKYLPTAEAAILQKSSPFFVVVFAAILLKEKVTKIDVISLILAFVGVAIITKPTGDFNIYSIVAFLSALFAAMAYVIIGMLKGKEEGETVMLAFGLVTVVILAPFMIKGFKVPNAKEALGMLMVGIGGACGQYFLTKSYLMAPASKVSIYNYSSVVFSSIFGYFLFGDKIDFATGIGMILVFVAAFISFKSTQKA